MGTVFGDLDLDLDLGDDDEEVWRSSPCCASRINCMLPQYNENDPNDRRRSQYLMKAKLDEIERVCVINVLAKVST